MERRLEIVNLVGSRLVDLKSKGNLDYAEELYNPLNFFHCVHHISVDRGDEGIVFKNPTIKVHILKAPHFGRMIDAFFHLHQIIRVVRREKICLIRGRSPSYASLLGLMAAKICGIPFVISVGANLRLSYKVEGGFSPSWQWVAKKLEAIILKGADKVFCSNQYLKDYVMGIGVYPQKIAVIPLRLKDDVFHFTCKDFDILTKYGVRLDRPIILFVGRFTLYKQIDRLIETIPLVVKECPEVQFVLIGDGSLKSSMEQRVSALGERHRVFFLGFQPTEVVKYCLHVSTTVFAPMSGFVIYEAAAASKAIIAFDVEWHSEFIINEQTGLLIENRSCEQLAEAIKRLVSDPQLANLLGENARMLIDIKFNPQAIAEKEICELLKIIKGNRHTD